MGTTATAAFQAIPELGQAASGPVPVNPEELIWRPFLRQYPVELLLRPDYFLVFKYTDSCHILYQENLTLDLGGAPVRYENLMEAVTPEDRQYIRSVDQSVIQIVRERRLQPFDFIYRIGGNVECTNPAFRRMLRSAMLIHSGPGAMIGLMCFHDVSNTVTTVKARSFDMSSRIGLEFLSQELQARVAGTAASLPLLTTREREIVHCLRQGLSSKQIAASLHISKNTVDTHRQNMLRKWDLPNTAALLQRALVEGWL